MKRIKGFARRPDTPDNVEQVTHGNTGGRHSTVATLSVAHSCGMHNGIVALGDDGREEESFAQAGIADFGHAGPGVNGRARGVLSGVDTGKRDELFGVFEQRDVLDFSHENAGGLVADPADGVEQIMQTLEIRMSLDVTLDEQFKRGKHVIEEGNVLAGLLAHVRRVGA